MAGGHRHPRRTDEGAGGIDSTGSTAGAAGAAGTADVTTAARGSAHAHGRLRTAAGRLLATRAEIEASEERQESERAGCSAVAELGDRRRAAVAGVLRSVTLRSRQTVPALEADLFDGTGTLRLVWLGRRRIAGVEPGRRALVQGFVCTQDGRRTMYNPRYELTPRPGE